MREKVIREGSELSRSRWTRLESKHGQKSDRDEQKDSYFVDHPHSLLQTDFPNFSRTAIIEREDC